MGTDRLCLTRRRASDIAKRIERGQLRVLEALSRSPLLIRQIWPSPRLEARSTLDQGN